LNFAGNWKQREKLGSSTKTKGTRPVANRKKGSAQTAKTRAHARITLVFCQRAKLPFFLFGTPYNPELRALTRSIEARGCDVKNKNTADLASDKCEGLRC